MKQSSSSALPTNIQFTTAKTLKDLRGIVNLHKKNLYSEISEQKRKETGFLFTKITYDLLMEIEEIFPNGIAIAKINDEVCAYTIFVPRALLTKFDQIKDMEPILKTVQFKGKPLCQYNYLYGIQVCVQQKCRKKSVFLHVMHNVLKQNSSQYDLFLVSALKSNFVGLKAYKNIGFILADQHSWEQSDSQFGQCQLLLLEWNNLKNVPILKQNL